MLPILDSTRYRFKRTFLLACVGIGLLASSLAQAQSKVMELVAQTQKQFAPDKRIAIFQVEVNGTVLRGKTNLPKAKEALFAKLKAEKLDFQDSIRLLPDKTQLGERTFGVVTVSVSNIRTNAKHSAELATQALLGMPVTVLEQEDEWLSVQTPDKYIAWAAPGSIKLMDKTSFERWQKAKKIVCIVPFTFTYTEPSLESQTISDLVAGCMMEWLGDRGDFYQVAYPDGRTAYVSKYQTKPYDQWLSNLKTNEESLVKTSKQLMGIPYLWGGTSFKGVDCSGFTKTVYFMNGLVLPRDASQQVYAGEEVDTSKGFESLKPGDLLFFGKKAEDGKPEKVVHVGMWIGNMEFIHSSGMVKINSFDPKAPNFNEYELNRFLRVKRILGSNLKGVMSLKPQVAQ
ncbi:MAG: NlpC/P60 family protein [Spirosomataceae bacterium]